MFVYVYFNNIQHCKIYRTNKSNIIIAINTLKKVELGYKTFRVWTLSFENLRKIPPKNEILKDAPHLPTPNSLVPRMGFEYPFFFFLIYGFTRWQIAPAPCENPILHYGFLGESVHHISTKSNFEVKSEHHRLVTEYNGEQHKLAKKNLKPTTNILIL